MIAGSILVAIAVVLAAIALVREIRAGWASLDEQRQQWEATYAELSPEDRAEVEAFIALADLDRGAA